MALARLGMFCLQLEPALATGLKMIPLQLEKIVKSPFDWLGFAAEVLHD